MSEDIDETNTFYNIYKYLTDKPVLCCNEVIENILKNLKESDLLLTESSNPSTTSAFSITLSSICVLLKLYKKLFSNDNKNLTKLSSELIFRHVEDILSFKNQNNCLSNNQLQKSLLEIISLLYTIAFLHDSEEDICTLANFNHSVIKFLDDQWKSGDFNNTSINLRLKILCTINETLTVESEKKVNQQNILFLKEKLHELKIDSMVDECKLFANFAVNGSDDIAIQTLLFVIPSYVKFCRSINVIEVVWGEIVNSISCESEIKYDKSLFILCYLYDIFIDNNILGKNEDCVLLFFNNSNYWYLIQFGLVKKDPLIRKKAMYLLKKSINLLETSQLNILCDEGTEKSNCKGKIFQWNVNSMKELVNIYTEIITILEFLDEQQIHIIKPIFQMVDKLVVKITEFSNSGVLVCFSWVILLYQKALNHENAQIIRWGLINLLKLPDYVLNDDLVVKKIVSLLVSTLNNTTLYYNNGIGISKDLIIFFDRIISVNVYKNFLNLFLKEICDLTWSSEALFFVAHALANTQKILAWEKEEISHLKIFISKAFKTHNKLIRVGIQYDLIYSVIKLTNVKSVEYENIILLLSSFPVIKSLQKNVKVWEEVIGWLKNSYSQKDAEKVFEKYKSGLLSKEFSESSCALMFILFFYTYEHTNTEAQYPKSNGFVTSKFLEILLSFKDVPKRLYCDKLIFDHYLSIVFHILEESIGDDGVMIENSLTKSILSCFNDIIYYIQFQVKSVSGLQDFHSCQLYIKTFEIICKIKNSFKTGCENVISTFFVSLIDDIKMYQMSNSNVPSVRIYCGMKFLKIMVETSFNTIESSNFDFLNLYIVKEINNPLVKDENYSDKTKDVQTLWGRMNSEYLEAKWKLFEQIYVNEIKFHEMLDCTSVENGNYLAEILTEALNVCGYGVLNSVMSVLKKYIPKWENDEISTNIIDLIWKIIMERRKTDEFKSFVKNFVQMVFQHSLIMNIAFQKSLSKYTDLIFADSSCTVVNIFVKHVQQMKITEETTSLLGYIVSKGLIYGPVQKKDERLTMEVCFLIQSYNICSDKGGYSMNNEIRARCVQIILTLDRLCPTHQNFAQKLVDTLLKMEKEVNKNKIRYFGDSHVHRVKHRLLQTLLLLEPFLCSRKEKAEELLKWSYNSLMSGNPQPSVKYQLEWLMIKILIRHQSLLNRFWEYFTDSVEKKTKGICSLIAMSYHLCNLVPVEMTASWIDKAIPVLLPFCMDQHFEIRLYALVVLEKLYLLAKNKSLNEVVKKYETVHECALQCIQRGCKGNAGKNWAKLQEDFYFTVFHPLEHYSLQTIYVDLPRLSNVGPDEWISTETFKLCGLDSTSAVVLENKNNSLEKLERAKWLLEKFPSADSKDENKDISTENYQKKMIPVKSLFPEVNETFTDKNYHAKKDGLVVVASLIDRIPNLGGLARTCEIFGATEFVINSLKYLEDKQFTSLSVTAEKWVTVKEVKIQNLLEYCLEMKEEGYTIVGAEQALFSQPLSSVKFPKKSLLLLGNEKEGIPPNLLPLLDICVEIPQVGIIRSLNVHVTGALFIWEYAKQNYFS